MIFDKVFSGFTTGNYGFKINNTFRCFIDGSDLYKISNNLLIIEDSILEDLVLKILIKQKDRRNANLNIDYIVNIGKLNYITNAEYILKKYSSYNCLTINEWVIKRILE